MQSNKIESNVPQMSLWQVSNCATKRRTSQKTFFKRDFCSFRLRHFHSVRQKCGVSGAWPHVEEDEGVGGTASELETLRGLASATAPN